MDVLWRLLIYFWLNMIMPAPVPRHRRMYKICLNGVCCADVPINGQSFD